MKHQALFSSKDNSKKLKCHLLQFLFVTLRVDTLYLVYYIQDHHQYRGRSGGVMVLGKLPVLERPTNLDNSGARAFCICSRCQRGLIGHFFSRLSLLFSLSLSLGDGPI